MSSVAGFLFSLFCLLSAFSTTSGITREKVNALVE
jgi:hypothetical protein